MTYDFNSGRTQRSAFNETLNGIVDAGIDRKGAEETQRTYLGASQIGDECARRVQYEIMGVEGDPFPPRIRRIFERGHTFETLMLKWLRLAGFKVSDVKADGNQHGFAILDGRYQGHVDGVILGCDHHIEGLSYPCLWENKALGAKGFKAVEKDGVVKAYPKYAAQISQYAAYMDLTNPVLFTTINADTMDVFYEAVPFDEVGAQTASDRAALIIRATDAGELLPRISSDPDKFPCGWCSKKRVCWGDA